MDVGIDSTKFMEDCMMSDLFKVIEVIVVCEFVLDNELFLGINSGLLGLKLSEVLFSSSELLERDKVSLSF